MIKKILNKLKDSNIDTYILIVGLLFMLCSKTWCLTNIIYNKLMSDS